MRYSTCRWHVLIYATSFVLTDIDAPIQLPGAGAASSGPEPSPEIIGMLTDMGFTTAQVKKALRETVRALFISVFVNMADNHPSDCVRAATPIEPLIGCSTILMTPAKRLRRHLGERLLTSLMLGDRRLCLRVSD